MSFLEEDALKFFCIAVFTFVRVPKVRDLVLVSLVENFAMVSSSGGLVSLVGNFDMVYSVGASYGLLVGNFAMVSSVGVRSLWWRTSPWSPQVGDRSPWWRTSAWSTQWGTGSGLLGG